MMVAMVTVVYRCTSDVISDDDDDVVRQLIEVLVTPLPLPLAISLYTAVRLQSVVARSRNKVYVIKHARRFHPTNQLRRAAPPHDSSSYRS